MTRFILTAVMILSVPSLLAQPGEPALFLTRYAGLSQEDLSSIKKGAAVSRVLDPSAPTEVVPFGTIKVDIPAELFIQRFSDIATFKKAEEVLQIGKFHSPPRLEDLDSLTLAPGELETLRRCRVGNCGIKMSGEMISRLEKEVDWAAPDWQRMAMAAYRRILFDYVSRYAREGPAALAVYRDKADPLRLGNELRSIINASPYLGHYVPELNSHLVSSPDRPLPDSEHFLYWSQERFGFKPVVSITDVSICRVARGNAISYVIASMQVYASHYFTGSLGLAAFVDRDRGRPGSDAYLIYLNRTRVDLLQGAFSGLKRFFIRRRLLDGMEKYLRLVKQRLEDDFRSGVKA